MTFWWEWGIAGTAAFLVGLSKTGIAGLGILSVALFAGILPARESVGIVLVVLIGADFVAAGSYRRDASWSHILRLFPWTVPGVVAGALVMGRIDDLTVRRLIGGIIVGLSVLHILRLRLKALRLEAGDGPASPHRAVALITGVSAGFTTMVANASGPIMMAGR